MRVGAALREDVDAETGAAGEAVGEVDGAGSGQLVHEVALAPDEAHRAELGLVGKQPLDAREADGLELTVHLDLRRPAHGQVQVRDAGRRVQHGFQQRV